MMACIILSVQVTSKHQDFNPDFKGKHDFTA